jgi:hypothetical protein
MDAVGLCRSNVTVVEAVLPLAASVARITCEPSGIVTRRLMKDHMPRGLALTVPSVSPPSRASVTVERGVAIPVKRGAVAAVMPSPFNPVSEHEHNWTVTPIVICDVCTAATSGIDDTTAMSARFSRLSIPNRPRESAFRSRLMKRRMTVILPKFSDSGRVP